MSAELSAGFAIKPITLTLALMNYTLSVFFGYSLLIAGVIGMVRFKKIEPAYYPFLFLIWLGLLNETVSLILIKYQYHTIINNNVYVLLEALFITWFFRRNGLFKSIKVFSIVLIMFCILWLGETYLRAGNKVLIIFRIAYSFAIVLMSINTINTRLLASNEPLLKSATFFICIGFITYFTLKILVNAFWLYGLYSSLEFQRNIYHIMTYVNLFTNLIYALAVLWIPKKQPSILLL